MLALCVLNTLVDVLCTIIPAVMARRGAARRGASNAILCGTNKWTARRIFDGTLPICWGWRLIYSWGNTLWFRPTLKYQLKLSSKCNFSSLCVCVCVLKTVCAHSRCLSLFYIELWIPPLFLTTTIVLQSSDFCLCRRSEWPLCTHNKLYISCQVVVINTKTLSADLEFQIFVTWRA